VRGWRPAARAARAVTDGPIAPPSGARSTHSGGATMRTPPSYSCHIVGAYVDGGAVWFNASPS